MSHQPGGSPEQSMPSYPWAKNPWQQPAPQEPKRSKTLRHLVLGGVGALVLALGMWGIAVWLEHSVFTAQRTAEEYLQALIEGDAETALRLLGPNVTDQQRQLATNEIYQAATARPDRYEITHVDQSESRAQIEVKLYQSGKAYPLSLGLKHAGTKFGVLNDWQLEAGDVSGRTFYPHSGGSLLVNGIEISLEPAPTSTGELPNAQDTGSDPQEIRQRASQDGLVVLPGTYTFAAGSGPVTLIPGAEAEVTITPGEVAGYVLAFAEMDAEGSAEEPADHNIDTETDVPENTPALAAEAAQLIERRLEACIADTHIRLPECEVASWEDLHWGAMTDIRRWWHQPPEIVIEPMYLDATVGQPDELTRDAAPLVARIYGGTIMMTYQVRDKAEEEWSDDLDLVYAPFQSDTGAAMELPVNFDGDQIVVDFSPLDTFHPEWLKPERRHE